MNSEDILKDKKILTIYETIEKNEVENKGLAFHGKQHAINVMINIEKILNIIKCDEKIISDAKVAALLHDLGCIKGKDNHEERSYFMAMEYLNNNNVNIYNKNMILEAIKKHRNCFESQNVLTLALILADKIDITKERLAPEGYKMIGNRQLQYIDSVELRKSENYFIVSFNMKENYNLEELLQFKFMQKVIKSIRSFARYNNLQSKIYIDKKEI